MRCAKPQPIFVKRAFVFRDAVRIVIVRLQPSDVIQRRCGVFIAWIKKTASPVKFVAINSVVPVLSIRIVALA